MLLTPSETDDAEIQWQRPRYWVLELSFSQQLQRRDPWRTAKTLRSIGILGLLLRLEKSATALQRRHFLRSSAMGGHVMSRLSTRTGLRQAAILHLSRTNWLDTRMPHQPLMYVLVTGQLSRRPSQPYPAFLTKDPCHSYKRNMTRDFRFRLGRFTV